MQESGRCVYSLAQRAAVAPGSAGLLRSFAQATTASPLPHSPTHYKNKKTKNKMGEYTGSVIRLSIGFFFLFAAFNTVQTLEASILTDKSLAFATLSTIYGVFTFTNIAAPKIVSILGPRLGMFLGSLCYITLVVANLYPSWYTLLPASAAVGVGAAVLWTSQGMYMSRSAAREAAATGEKVDDVTSRLNGLFFAMFQFNGALGLGVVGLIFLALPSPDQRKDVSEASGPGGGTIITNMCAL